MTNVYEHPDQKKYEAYDLTVNQWKEVISKAESAAESDLHMYILMSMANEQAITNGSIAAFRHKIIENIQDRRSGSSAIGTITKWVRSVTGNPKASFFEWNTIRGEWTIGYYQSCSLRMAFGASRAPSGSLGIE